MAARPASEIELVKKRVLSERVEILIPKGFEVMTEQQMDFAYAKAQSRPSVIFTNNNLISLAFNYSDNDADQGRRVFKDHRFSGRVFRFAKILAKG